MPYVCTALIYRHQVNTLPCTQHAVHSTHHIHKERTQDHGTYNTLHSHHIYSHTGTKHPAFSTIYTHPLPAAPGSPGAFTGQTFNSLKCLTSRWLMGIVVHGSLPTIAAKDEVDYVIQQHLRDWRHVTGNRIVVRRYVEGTAR